MGVVCLFERTTEGAERGRERLAADSSLLCLYCVLGKQADCAIAVVECQVALTVNNSIHQTTRRVIATRYQNL
jgi:hypothetical protein